MKKPIILTLLFLLIFQNIAPGVEPVKFIQITDVHTTPKNVSELEPLIEAVNKEDADFAVFTGDNIDKADLTSLDLFLNEVKKMF